jgi:predicted site-specific integrase-resolvase
MTHSRLTTGKAAAYLGRHPKTLQGWDRSGVLPAKRTKTGRRYWDKEDLDKYLGKTEIKPIRSIIAYCRVSSQNQRPDLKNQRSILESFCLARTLANVEFITEIGGGLNFKRKYFTEIMDRITRGEVEKLIVAHRDRLTRFGFDLISHICETNNCELLVLDQEKLSPEREMVEDLMTIVHCFSSRLYGLRNYKKSLKEALKNQNA